MNVVTALRRLRSAEALRQMASCSCCLSFAESHVWTFRSISALA
jgi:hypothetical protein